MTSNNFTAVDTLHPSLKDRVILLLGNNASLNLKQIHSFLAKESGKSVSNQAVHKLLTELSTKGVVLKNEKKYSLNHKWVDNTKKFFEHVEKDNNAKRKEILATVIENNSYYGWGRNLLQFLAEETDKGLVKDPFLFSKHLPWILVLQKDDFEWFKKIATIPWNVLCRENNLFDQAMAVFYSKIGHKVVLGTKYESHCDIMIYGNKVLQIFFPEKLKQILDHETKSLKDISQLLTPYYKEIMYRQDMKTKTIVIEDQELADNLRQDMKKALKALK